MPLPSPTQPQVGLLFVSNNGQVMQGALVARLRDETERNPLTGISYEPATVAIDSSVRDGYKLIHLRDLPSQTLNEWIIWPEGAKPCE